ncbi:MAG TPA: phenylalanine--tRNA ligase subunit alpha [Oscillospiraceae bacterium]|nr:phenylalanine--tRNA ligase subunit alpha [Oscillospiraceae bacterium]
MEKQLKTIKSTARGEIDSALSRQELETLRVKFLGKKGELTTILKQMGSLSPSERPVMGALANEVRGFIGNALEEKMTLLAKSEQIEKLKSEAIDVTIPGTRRKLGSRHPLTVVLDEVKDIFLGMGFQIATGPEVEWDYYNFEALNIPKDHPARDTQDTFYITEKILLRTQTSPVQIRVMENTKPPIRIIAPGRVYRADTVDATHSPVFHQVEGLVVDKGISMSVLKGSLMQFAKRLYGNDTKIRLRPHHFPFTEPSCEMDVSCFVCGGKGCSMCKNEGWIEILGAGMVHPKVLENGGIDPEIYSGYAFGVGLERLTLFKYSINDLRLFFENDLRFLSQF